MDLFRGNKEVDDVTSSFGQGVLDLIVVELLHFELDDILVLDDAWKIGDIIVLLREGC